MCRGNNRNNAEDKKVHNLQHTVILDDIKTYFKMTYDFPKMQAEINFDMRITQL